MKKLTLPALELTQDGTRLILTKMRAGDLKSFTRVDPYDNTKEFNDPTQGYQRPAETPRIKKFANFLRREAENGNSVRMPTSILLSARGTDIALSPNGTITLKEHNKLPLVDGQHRERGFRFAIEEKEMAQFANYEIPIVIMMEIDKIAEMKQFKIVNGEQKSVRTDLVNMILTQVVQTEGEGAVDEGDLWKVASSLVVKKLSAEVGGPWYDRIVMPDQRAYSKAEQDENPLRTHLRIARATSFISALKPIENYLGLVLSDTRTVQERADDLYNAVSSFWNALYEMNPDCFDNANDYVMLKTPGIFSLHRLCLEVMKNMYTGHRDWDKEGFNHMLKNCEELSTPSFWLSGSKETDGGDASKYGSMKGFKELSMLLNESRNA